jgi:hypothetical protein
MKKATLFGMIGAIMIALLQVFWSIVNLAEISIGFPLYKFTNLISLVGWLFIGYFFVELYKKQK